MHDCMNNCIAYCNMCSCALFRGVTMVASRRKAPRFKMDDAKRFAKNCLKMTKMKHSRTFTFFVVL